MQDRAQLRDLDSLTTQLEDARRENIKLARRLKEQQLDMEKMRQQLQGGGEGGDVVENMRRKLEMQIAELEAVVEMSVLDKEVAEERADAAVDEMAVLRSKIEELELSLEVYKRGGGGSLSSTSTSSSSSSSNAVDVVHLERQNVRLKDALLR